MDPCALYTVPLYASLVLRFLFPVLLQNLVRIHKDALKQSIEILLQVYQIVALDKDPTDPTLRRKLLPLTLRVRSFFQLLHMWRQQVPPEYLCLSITHDVAYQRIGKLMWFSKYVISRTQNCRSDTLLVHELGLCLSLLYSVHTVSSFSVL